MNKSAREIKLKKEVWALFDKKAPDRFYAKVKNFVYALPITKEKIEIVPAVEGWFIKNEGITLLSPTAKFLFTLKSFSRKFERFFKIERGDIAFDVGACIGDTTVPMAMKVGNNGLVIAVEPEPINVKFLKLNTSRFGNVKVVEVAAWNKKKKINFFVHEAISGHSILKEFRRGQIEVEADTLDNVAKPFEKVDYVKIDVQGVELQVLEGASMMLENARKVVVETHYRYDERRRTYPKVSEFLKTRGFSVRVTQDGIVHAWK